MKQLTISLVTDDRAYGNALVRALQNRNDSFLITRRSSRDFINEWKKKGISFRSGYDVILWDGPEGERICGGNIIWISDDPKKTSAAEDSPIVYRYDRASQIRGRILSSYQDRTGNRLPAASDRKTRMIAFASWQGGSGCSTVCRAVGQELTRFYGLKVLVMTLDDIEGWNDGEYGNGYGSGYNIDMFLYRLLDGRGGCGGSKGNDISPPDIDVEQFIAEDGYGLNFLRPSQGRNPLTGLVPADSQKVIESIVGGSRFDAVLVDVGDCCSDGAAEMIAIADRVCCIGREEQAERERRYRNWIGSLTDDGIHGSMITVRNCAVASADDGEFCLPERRDRSDEILLEGEFGNNIHALTELLWYNNHR